MNASKCDVKRLDHLGMTAGFCKEIGLNEWVDTHFDARDVVKKTVKMPARINLNHLGANLIQGG